jgi:zinc/manganese transport system substrate-binding protein
VRLLALLLLVVSCLATVGCGASSGGGGGRHEVVATTTQVGDFARVIGGDRVHLRTLLRANADPHAYEPRPSDVRTVGEADLVLRSGGDVDDWLDRVLSDAGSHAARLTLIDRVPKQRLNGKLDPHWWQNPRNVALVVPVIRDALTRVDPGGRAEFERRAAAYSRRLAVLDRGIARCVASVPPAQRKIVTTHDALGYFARRYGVTVVGALIPSLSTQAQPSARDIERLVSQIRREHVRAIFPESSINPKLERAVARETGARTGGHLWADALGPPGSSGDTYLHSMASNARSLVEGMSGGTRSCRLAP